MSLTKPWAGRSNKVHTIPFPIHSVKGVSITHAFCNSHGIEILRNDSYIKAANLFSYFAQQLDAGVNWADKGFKSFYHFYDAKTGSGVWRWPNAAMICEVYFNKAFALWKKKMHARAMFYLGAATHLVQDLCVPHHACCILTNGHTEFEKWAGTHRKKFCVNDGGMYVETKSHGEWVHLNAAFSRNYFSYVQANSLREHYHLATGMLLPRAQRSTSGFWLWFYKLINGELGHTVKKFWF